MLSTTKSFISRRNLRDARKVPGFRPGKAPVQVVKTRYRDEIVSEMMQHLLPKAFSDAVEERKLDIVHTPSFEKIDYSSGQPLRFKAVFEVYPELDISNYLGVPMEPISVDVTEAEVENALKQLQEEGAEMVPLEEDRPIKEGDFAEITFQGTLPDTEEAPISAEKVMCEVGGRTTLKEFTENLEGARVGEDRTFTVTYRPDYPERRLAGKAVEYKVKVENVKEKKLPEINDELAQGYGDYKTLDELKAKITADIETHKREHANEQMREKILEWLEDNNEFEVPTYLVERQLETRLQRLIRDLSRQGINPQRLDVDWGVAHQAPAVRRSRQTELAHRARTPRRRSGNRHRAWIAARPLPPERESCFQLKPTEVGFVEGFREASGERIRHRGVIQFEANRVVPRDRPLHAHKSAVRRVGLFHVVGVVRKI